MFWEREKKSKQFLYLLTRKESEQNRTEQKCNHNQMFDLLLAKERHNT